MTSRAVPARAFFDLLEVARGAFSAPGFALFSRLLTGWVLAPGRRTIAAMFIAGDPQAIRSLDASCAVGAGRSTPCGALWCSSWWAPWPKTVPSWS
jgi:hypothetical protein